MTAACPPVRLTVCRLPHSLHPTPLPLPTRATAGASGFDVFAAVASPVAVPPGARIRVPTGLRVAVPNGYEIQVRPRSGRAWREGLTVLNAPGTIDADFRGEVEILLVNLGQAPVAIERGERIAQLVVCPVPEVLLEEVPTLDGTTRDGGGFGHTGA